MRLLDASEIIHRHTLTSQIGLREKPIIGYNWCQTYLDEPLAGAAGAAAALATGALAEVLTGDLPFLGGIFRV